MELKAITFRRQQLVNSSTCQLINRGSKLFAFAHQLVFILHYSHTLISFAVFIIICIF